MLTPQQQLGLHHLIFQVIPDVLHLQWPYQPQLSIVKVQPHIHLTLTCKQLSQILPSPLRFKHLLLIIELHPSLLNFSCQYYRLMSVNPQRQLRHLKQLTISLQLKLLPLHRLKLPYQYHIEYLVDCNTLIFLVQLKRPHQSPILGVNLLD